MSMCRMPLPPPAAAFAARTTTSFAQALLTPAEWLDVGRRLVAAKAAEIAATSNPPASASPARGDLENHRRRPAAVAVASSGSASSRCSAASTTSDEGGAVCGLIARISPSTSRGGAFLDIRDLLGDVHCLGSRAERAGLSVRLGDRVLDQDAEP